MLMYEQKAPEREWDLLTFNVVQVFEEIRLAEQIFEKILPQLIQQLEREKGKDVLY